jgi:bifunctional N-acetylglucosamine-1-phosphate-uridyltransferase/glucosamine-1-phosphate-acetyltransferase GlmU-like protein
MPRPPPTPARIITVLPRQSEQIQDWLDGREFCIQDKPLGTGHAALAAAPDLADFDGVALIMFADTPLVTADTLSHLASSVDAIIQVLLYWVLKQLIRNWLWPPRD